MKTFTDRMIEKIRQKKTLLNVGLDPQLKFIPPELIYDALCFRKLRNEVKKKKGNYNYYNYELTLEGIATAFLSFNKQIIDAVEPYCISVKPQVAFYEAYGHWGIWCLEQSIKYAHDKGLLVIIDAKRGDGGDTAQAYADNWIGEVQVPVVKNKELEFISKPSPLRVDSLTIHGWIGSSCIIPFWKR